MQISRRVQLGLLALLLMCSQATPAQEQEFFPVQIINRNSSNKLLFYDGMDGTKVVQLVIPANSSVWLTRDGKKLLEDGKGMILCSPVYAKWTSIRYVCTAHEDSTRPNGESYWGVLLDDTPIIIKRNR